MRAISVSAFDVVAVLLNHTIAHPQYVQIDVNLHVGVDLEDGNETTVVHIFSLLLNRYLLNPQVKGT